MCRGADAGALRLVTRDIATYDYTPLLRRQTLPILLIRSEHDRDINAQLGSTIEALGTTPSFRLAELPGAGHFANLEQPAAFEELLAEFLGATRDETRHMEVLGA